jgi:hypothetical protein
MDKKAKNFNAKAEIGKVSDCSYWVRGCTNSKARNFNKKADKDDGSCLFWVLGCTDKKATNFDKKATKDNGTCKFVVPVITSTKAKCWLSAVAGCFHPETSATRTK